MTDIPIKVNTLADFSDHLRKTLDIEDVPSHFEYGKVIRFGKNNVYWAVIFENHDKQNQLWYYAVFGDWTNHHAPQHWPVDLSKEKHKELEYRSRQVRNVDLENRKKQNVVAVAELAKTWPKDDGTVCHYLAHKGIKKMPGTVVCRGALHIPFSNVSGELSTSQ